MPIDQNTPQFAAFMASIPPAPLADPEGSKAPRSWATGTGLGSQLSDKKQNRADLVALSANPNEPVEAVCWSILAWGGMHGSNRNRLIGQTCKEWLSVAQAVRAGQCSRAQAYAKFAKLSDSGRLVGMGPAYFTKLIFFLMPRNGQHPIGYIMDQWVACSVNLLAGEQLVLMNATLNWDNGRDGLHLDTNFRVSDFNTAGHYEAYCAFIEELAGIIDREPDETELLLMSAGGHNPRPWRQYVVQNRQPPHE